MKNSTCLYRLLGGTLIVFSSVASSQLPVISNVHDPIGATVNDPAGKKLIVNQDDLRAIVDWNSFSIDEGYTVHFEQNKDQAILNRVAESGGRSELLGTLTAGGTVWLINPNGILIGDSGSIQTQSFIASTLALDNEPFLNSDDFIMGLHENGSTGTILNEGTISAQGGDVILVARHVDNQGKVYAADGQAVLAAGDEVQVTLHEQRILNVAVNPSLNLGNAIGVNHEGIIQAAQAELMAAGGNMYSLAVNVGGTVQADGTLIDGGHQPGSIRLLTEDGRIVVRAGAFLESDGGSIIIEGADSQVGGALAASEIRLWGNDTMTVDASGTLSGQYLAVRSDAELSIAGELLAREFLEISGDHVAIRSGARIAAETGSGIDITGAAEEAAREIVIEESALLEAGGESGSISLRGKNILLEGRLLAEAGRIELSNAESIQAATATIQTAQLGLFGVASADISGSDNAIAKLLLMPVDQFGLPLAVEPGDLYVDSGRGTLDVMEEGAVQFENLTLISQGDLRLDEDFSVDVSERATLASLEGRLVNKSMLRLFEGAQFIRLYARYESDLGDLIVDHTGEAVFPNDPDQQSRTVFYRIVDAPEPEPQPEPDAGENPNDQGEDEPRQAAMDSLGRDSAHQQQAARQGSGFILMTDPATGLPTMFVAAGRVGVSTTDNPPSEGSPGVNIYPAMPGYFFEGGDGELDDDWDSPYLNLEDFVISPEVIQALLANKGRIDAENEDLLEQLLNGMGDQGGSGWGFRDEEELNAYRNNLDNLINTIIRGAAEQGSITPEQLDQLLNEAGRRISDADRGYDLDRDIPEIDRSAGLDPDEQQRRREEIERQTQQRQQRLQEQEQRRQEAEQRNKELLARIEEQRKQQQEANQRAQDERQREAEERFANQLSEEQRRLLEERMKQREQEREGQGSQQPGSESGDASTPVAVAPGSEDNRQTPQGSEERSEEGSKTKQDIRDELRQRSQERQAQQGSPGPSEDGTGAGGSSSNSGSQVASGSSGLSGSGGVLPGSSGPASNAAAQRLIQAQAARGANPVPVNTGGR